ncbi:MAG TPA: outer membrane lipoprotein-sorting protein [Chitinophagales bacterium]|nr:outer membrane lipoprotein-sorting protein [Chitinophagales bacterium]
MKFSFCIFLLFLHRLFSFSQSFTATDVIRKAEDNVRGSSNRAELKMTIVRPSWSREMTMKTWAKGDELALILITAPARDYGIAYLRRGKELWNWQPSIDRLIKLPPSMMLQSWMGSDFTNDDLVKESSSVKDYYHAFGNDTVIAGHECYKIILTPKPEAAVAWGKIYSWITKKDFIQLRVEFYDEDGELVNTMTGSDIREFDGRLIPAKIEMEPSGKPGHKTIIEHLFLTFNEPIPDDFFTEQNMKRVK